MIPCYPYSCYPLIDSYISMDSWYERKVFLTNLLEYLENVTKVLDEGDPLDVIYLDFAKAFDN